MSSITGWHCERLNRVQWANLRPSHTAQTQTNSQLSLPDHSVARCAANSTVACTLGTCVRCNKWVVLFSRASTPKELQYSKTWKQEMTERKAHTEFPPPCGSKSFQRSWTHWTDLFLNLSKSPQMFQMCRGWAVFLPLLSPLWSGHSDCSTGNQHYFHTSTPCVTVYQLDDTCLLHD